MKLLIASDIHGSAKYCRLLLEAYAREEADRLLLLGDILLHGHTHIPACEENDDFVYMNPGSVTMRKDNSEQGYIIFDGTDFVWKTLAGNEYMRYERNSRCGS